MHTVSRKGATKSADFLRIFCGLFYVIISTVKSAGRAAAEKAAALFRDYNLSQTRNSGEFCSVKMKIHYSVKG